MQKQPHILNNDKSRGIFHIKKLSDNLVMSEPRALFGYILGYRDKSRHKGRNKAILYMEPTISGNR